MIPKPKALFMRVAAAWPVMLAIWLTQLGLAWLLAYPTHAAANAAATGFGYVEDGHLLFSVIELLAETPAVAAALTGGLMASAIVGFILWFVFAGAALAALRGQISVGDAMGRGISLAPRMAVQGVYVTVLRALMLAPSFLPGVAGKVGAGLGALLFLATIPVFDRLRANISAKDAAKVYGPKQVLLAIQGALRTPFASIPAVLLWIGGLVVSATLLVYGLAHMEQVSMPWLLRLGSTVPVAFGFLRLSLALAPARPAKAAKAAKSDTSDTPVAQTEPVAAPSEALA